MPLRWQAQLGLVGEVVSADALREKTYELARRLTSGPGFNRDLDLQV
jgi:hypothetical protein